MKYSDIPKVVEKGRYSVVQSWSDLIYTIDRYIERYKLQLDPDFQRGHVWTKKQQIAYVEYKLSGGMGSDVLYFNCVGWMNTFEGPFVLVDGKQRLEAVMQFLNNKIKAFGHYFSEYEGLMPSQYEFQININNLKTREEVLGWYLELNSGGTPHTKAELDKVRELLKTDNGGTV